MSTVPPNLTVEKLMINDVRCIGVDMTVKDAIGLLLENKISGAPVLDPVKKVITIVSQGDLMKLAANRGLTAAIGTCLQMLPQTKKLITIKRDAVFAELYRKFLGSPVHLIIVVDDNGRLQGLVSRSTVLRVLYGPTKGKSVADLNATDSRKKTA